MAWRRFVHCLLCLRRRLDLRRRRCARVNPSIHYGMYASLRFRTPLLRSPIITVISPHMIRYRGSFFITINCDCERVCVNCTCQRPYRKFDGGRGVSRFSLARPAGGGPSTVLSLSHTPIYTRRCGSGGRGRGVLNTRAPAPAPIIATYASFGSVH